MKKIVSIALIVSMFGILAQANGETGNIITYDKAKEIMLSNNRTLKSLAIEERKAFVNYNLVVQNTKNLKTDGIKYKIGGFEFFYEFDDNTKLNMTIRKEYFPAEYKYYWNRTATGKTITEKSLSLSLRDLYLGLMKAYKDYDMAQKKYQLTENKHNINQLKFEQGLITRQDLDESEYELLKAEKSVEEAKRNKENTVRTLNSLLGTDISTEYDGVKFDELKRDLTLKPLEYYIEKALAERNEIKSIEEELRLIDLKKGIIEKSRVFKKNYDIMEQYEDLELQIETLKAKMEKTRFDIENEIKKAYIEIKNDLNTIESTTETIKMQKRNLDKMKQQYERGLIPKIVIDEMEIGIEELENTKEYLIYSYNTKIMKLEEASGLGPAYGKE